MFKKKVLDTEININGHVWFRSKWSMSEPPALVPSKMLGNKGGTSIIAGARGHDESPAREEARRRDTI